MAIPAGTTIPAGTHRNFPWTHGRAHSIVRAVNHVGCATRKPVLSPCETAVESWQVGYHPHTALLPRDGEDAK